MNDKLKEIIGFFRLERLRNDRRIFVFIVCLLIATALWFLNALSKDYTTTISYAVKYTNPPQNLFLVNEPPQKLNLKVNAHGFTLLRHKLSISVSPVVLNLNSIAKTNEMAGTTVEIQTDDLVRRISEQVSSEISVTDVTPKTITFVFDSLQTKKVEVVADVDLQFKPQFFLNGSVSVKPDSVDITGPAAIIDTIFEVKTKNRKFEGMDAEVQRIVNLSNPDKTTVDPEKVTMRIPVERFTEKEFKIPVAVRNKPDDIDLKLFPSEVSVSFLVGLSDYESIKASDFSVYADYDSIKNNETIEVNVEQQPDFIQMLRVTPPNVEYLIEKD